VNQKRLRSPGALFTPTRPPIPRAVDGRGGRGRRGGSFQESSSFAVARPPRRGPPCTARRDSRMPSPGDAAHSRATERDVPPPCKLQDQPGGFVGPAASLRNARCRPPPSGSQHKDRRRRNRSVSSLVKAASEGARVAARARRQRPSPLAAKALQRDAFRIPLAIAREAYRPVPLVTVAVMRFLPVVSVRSSMAALLPASASSSPCSPRCSGSSRSPRPSRSPRR
jgi:hypothetical protein